MSFFSVRKTCLLGKLTKLGSGAIFSVLMLSSGNAAAETCTLTMGYRTNARPPLIGESPDNEGLYLDLFSAAAEKIGCQLKVERHAKKKLLSMIGEGTIDFYPGLNFTEKRSEIAFYIENGLPGGDVGISRSDLPEITELAQLKGHTLISALGGVEWASGIEGVKVMSLAELTTQKAIFLLKKKRGDFYIYNKSSLEYFIKENDVSDMKLHPYCCGGTKPLYLGFSRKSPNYSEIPNSHFDVSRPSSVANFAFRPEKKSVAYKLKNALRDMQDSGETQDIYENYYQ